MLFLFAVIDLTGPALPLQSRAARPAMLVIKYTYEGVCSRLGAYERWLVAVQLMC